MATRLWKILSRRRVDEEGKSSELARVLNIFDLTALGVGSTLGLGVYVLAGAVAKENAGPAICISFLIAAVASAFAGMCYAEFASRVPKAGSAYVYSYVTVGEFIAFVIGWNLILEYVIGTASVARGLSNYLDALLGNVMGQTLRDLMPINVSFLSDYPDFFAFAMVLLLTVLLSAGAKESSVLNNIFTCINLVTITMIIVAGAFKADPANWSISVEDIPANVTHVGTGGFMPFGFSGVMIGAAKCFFGFVGFDGVATTGEEAKNPQRNIPLAIVLSLIIVFIAYFSVSAVLTMMWPYYDQNPDAPFPYVFDQIGWPVIKWMVNIGAVFALCTSLVGAMFPLPRVLYAMASDGVIFKCLSRVHPRTMTPVLSTVLSGLLTGVMTLIFKLQQLIDMMSIGTLLAYTIVAISVLILRYEEDETLTKKASQAQEMGEYKLTPISIFKYTFNLHNQKKPSTISSAVANCGILIFSVLVFILGLLINHMNSEEFEGNPVLSVIVIILIIVLFLNMAAIGRQPVQDNANLSFKVPLVPLIPCCSIAINLYLMLQLDVFTWIRFLLWMIVGFSIYLFYGISHSVQGQKNEIAANTLTRTYADQVKIVTKF